MYLGGEGVEAVALLVDLEPNYPLLPRIHLHSKLVLAFLGEDIDVLPLFEADSFAEVVVILGFIGVVVVYIAGH